MSETEKYGIRSRF